MEKTKMVMDVAEIKKCYKTIVKALENEVIEISYSDAPVDEERLAIIKSARAQVKTSKTNFDKVF
jgi:hypothetical protein